VQCILQGGMADEWGRRESGGSQFETSRCNAGTPVAVHGCSTWTTSVRSGAGYWKSDMFPLDCGRPLQSTATTQIGPPCLP